jgi:type VI secretion system protein ImpF
MARPGDEGVLRASVLDRLLAGESSTGGSGVHDHLGVRELRNAVARDLEWLLNSRRWVTWDFEELEEARESILTYGVPDFATYSWRNQGDAKTISKVLEEVIRRFEPRLLPGSIRVELLPSGDVDDFRIHFRIDAVLYVEPIREAVSFDTDVDLDRSWIDVKGSG